MDRSHSPNSQERRSSSDVPAEETSSSAVLYRTPSGKPASFFTESQLDRRRELEDRRRREKAEARGYEPGPGDFLLPSGKKMSWILQSKCNVHNQRMDAQMAERPADRDDSRGVSQANTDYSRSTMRQDRFPSGSVGRPTSPQNQQFSPQPNSSAGSRDTQHRSSSSHYSDGSLRDSQVPQASTSAGSPMKSEGYSLLGGGNPWAPGSASVTPTSDHGQLPSYVDCNAPFAPWFPGMPTESSTASASNTINASSNTVGPPAR